MRVRTATSHLRPPPGLLRAGRWMGFVCGAMTGPAALLLAAIVVSAPECARASGFALNEESAKLMGMAYAGTAALAEDATAGYYNVAGLTRIQQGSLVGSITGLFLDLNFRATDASVFGQPVSGVTALSPSRNVAIPAFHGAWRLSDRWVVGLGVTAPYGLKIKYPVDSVVRYVATKSELVTYNLNPMIAFRINDQWSVGAGFNAQKVDAKLGQNIAIPIPMAPDGQILVKPSGWSWGANCGILYEPTSDMRFGVGYRSQISYSLSGPASVVHVPGFKSGSLTTDITLPDTVTASALVGVLPKLQLLGDLSWTHWAVFQQLQGTFNNHLPQLIIAENFRDTWRVSVGFNYALTDSWAVRMGGAFDQSPVTNLTRTVRIPDSDRWLLGVGVGYQLTRTLAFDLAYLHVFFDNGTVNETAQVPGSPMIQGGYTGTGDLLGLQVTYNFDHITDLYQEMQSALHG
jgi:long-chain fatty acid transport protein